MNHIPVTSLCTVMRLYGQYQRRSVGCIVQVGDLVWIVGRPHDGWVRSLGIITHIKDGWLYVTPNHNVDITYKLSRSDLDPFEEK